ncbi:MULTISPECIES: PTS transporter subunit EIIC [unclassified Breznakia]|uniref:PTS transporter subunit EIIC n=1 Tax=unclassified Breznakia TaxID=2623764 RepID=UPI002474CCC4|nr:MULTISPECIES: PTS transporter subunit EIIC [unclassified Breznakia]MDH6367958.1 phosphotransferase system glucose/maltose/N-acetylglucosamine-specific IIC component [Breznakia sp. PH1-1]MDH6405046.1 phosphotransferase system glucose/maltose/N-acetylglucosamine-specific IIC component [Breznakia sp. PF1-11]MDH6412761.1 phosphotransferase system glucose/maltose/N-acetylglucosamine-specific IIC component [Breznakia sp. PFB1-11]MDH6415102.1 phosphotransferase system glucose/maltose/N-acetylglucos
MGTIYTLFSFVGDAGFYFFPVFVGYTAAKQFNTSPTMALFLGAIMVHPALIQMAVEGVPFDVYGIPSSVQIHSGTVLPIILVVWIMSYVEVFLKKVTPDI